MDNLSPTYIRQNMHAYIHTNMGTHMGNLIYAKPCMHTYQKRGNTVTHRTHIVYISRRHRATLHRQRRHRTQIVLQCTHSVAQAREDTVSTLSRIRAKGATGGVRYSGCIPHILYQEGHSGCIPHILYQEGHSVCTPPTL
jgi:hypothetical protein